MPNLKFLLDESIAVPFGDGYYVVDDVIMDEDELKLYEHMKKLGINPSDRGRWFNLQHNNLCNKLFQ